jgi:NUMOD4 motif-containing protein
MYGKIGARVNDQNTHLSIASSQDDEEVGSPEGRDPPADYLALPEQWREIPGLEGYYEASTHGRIRSIPRPGTQGVVRKQVPTGKYHRMMVFISFDGERQNRYVGELVARTWIRERKPGEFVCHGPAGQSDNNPGNLYYGPPKRNTHDRKRDGTWMAGEQNGRARLNWEMVGQIRARCATGESQASLAREFRVGKTTIGSVVRNETWMDR